MLKPLLPSALPKPLRCAGKLNHNTNPRRPVMGANAGFTLIELMVVVAIIAILATIAVPSYRSYVKQNAEHQAQQRALTISSELASWRSKSLSYKGFIPRNAGCDNGDFCYSDATPTATGTLYVPLGSDDTTHKYAITIKDAQPVVAAAGAAPTVVPLTHPDAGGKGWRMLVEPNSNNSLLASAHSYYLDSLGQKCQYSAGINLPPLSAAEIKCEGAGTSVW